VNKPEPGTIKILLIDDDEDDYLVLRDYLMDINGQVEYVLDCVQTYQAGLEQIQRAEHHLYLVDHFLGEGSGLDLLKEAVQAGCKQPIIIITGNSNRDIDQAALVAGATDYLVKGQIDGQLLERSIRYALERNRLLNEIRDMALRDPLTGLYNLRELQRFLNYELIKSRRYNHPFSLLMVDIDNFKSINDQFSHRAGDEILLCVAQAFLTSTRGCDLTARYGGDEFTIVLPETSGHCAMQAAERLRKVVESLSISVNDKKGRSVKIPITVSIGVAEYPYDANSGDVLYELADQALYQAKHLGCNRVVHFQAKQRQGRGP